MIFSPKQIIVHHDGVSRKGLSFDIINQYHKDRHYPLSSLGFHCGYHIFIERDGTIVRARKIDEIGAHTQGQNYTALGIGLAGNFDEEDPTPEQENALSKELSILARTFNIDSTEIIPHRTHAPKTCYGNRLSDTWAQILFLKYEQSRIANALNDLGATPIAATKKKASGLKEKIIRVIKGI